MTLTEYSNASDVDIASIPRDVFEIMARVALRLMEQQTRTAAEQQEVRRT